MAAEKLDEMDLSREDALRRSEEDEQPLFCPHCAGQAIVQQHLCAGVAFPWRVFCAECKCSTPSVTLRAIALSLWNRRVARKPARLIDKREAAEHTPQRNPRSSGGSSAAGKRATGRKGAQSKGVKKS